MGQQKEKFGGSFRFKRLSFLLGLATVLDFGSTLSIHRISDSPFSSDAKSLANDWGTVGNDIQKAIGDFEQRANQN
ncbi:MAG: hypothetical protein ACRD82_18125 [Blastocatellia bacterium]